MSIDKNYTIRDIDQNENDWILQQLRSLRLYLENKSNQKLQEIPNPKFLDEYFQIALDDIKSDTLSEDALVNMFGVGFGQYFEEKANFQWVIFTDQYGDDLAIQNKDTSVIGFPLSSASKRLTDEYAGNFDAIFMTLTDSWKK